MIRTKRRARRKPRWGRKRLEVIWRQNDRLVMRRSQTFRQMQRDLFATQQRVVSDRLDDANISVFRSSARFVQKTGEELVDLIFNPTMWSSLFVARGLPVMRVTFSLAGRQVSDEFDLGPFDANTRRGRRFLRQRATFWAERVNTETSRLLVSEMAAGLDAGEAIPQLQDRVNKVFRFNDVVRSERIARTETLAGASAGQQDYYLQQDQIERKQWLTSIDGRERDAHRFANGQVRDKSEPFNVGGENLPMPGIGGSARNVVNCRCTTVPILSGQ